MGQISFKKQYVPLVKNGTKVQTLRARTSLKEGDIVKATCAWGDPPFASLRVTSVQWVNLEDLTEADARADGFDSLRDLYAALAKLYPGVERLAKIAFCVVEPAGAV